MWDWTKRFFTTRTPSQPTPSSSRIEALEAAGRTLAKARADAAPKPSAFEAIAISQAKAIEKIMAKQQELIAQQQATLDRIVAAKYDRPIAAPVQQIPSDRLPDFAMNDSDVFDAGIEALTVESDADFLGAVGAK